MSLFNNAAAWLAARLPRVLSRALSAVVMVGMVAMAPLLTGCASDDSPGEVVIGLTDANGDFMSYQVDVDSITLTRKDGTVVEVLPLTTRVDFAEYTEMTEFLTAAVVPGGTYVKAEMTVNYTDADVLVEVDGLPVRASLQDVDGNPLSGPLTMAVQLVDRDQLIIRPGVPAHVVFDFELAATNTVDLTDLIAPVVTVDPVLLAEVNLNFEKPHRLRGLLHEVVLEQDQFTLFARPFGHRDLEHYFGDFTVKVAAETEFEIDGVAYTGQDGLIALAQKSSRTPVVAMGHINRSERNMLAKRVRAGDSVPWGEQDVVKGVVVQRSGDMLTVQGGAISFADGRGCRNNFRRFVMVQLDPTATRVTGPGVDGLTTDAISIGQRITAVGDLSPAISCAPGDAVVIAVVPTLNADKVRMHFSSVSGSVSAVSSASGTNVGELVLTMDRFNGLPVSAYTFTGTGIDPANDADPKNYQIDTGNLDLSALVVGDRVRVRGLVKAFGQAPADFTARSLFTPPVWVETKALMQVLWQPPSGHPFNLTASAGLELDLAGSIQHFLAQRSGRTDLTRLTGPVTIVPKTDGLGRFGIHGGSNHLFRSFDRFQATLDRLIADGAKVRHLTAHGDWDALSQELAVGTVSVVLGRSGGPIHILPVEPMPRAGGSAGGGSAGGGPASGGPASGGAPM